MNPDGAQTAGFGRIRRVSAVLLSLVMPGAGHFLLGAFRRGAAWAVGLPLLGLLLLFAAPVSLLIVSAVIGLVVGVVGRVATAIDTFNVVTPRPSWTIVIVAWAALLVGDLALVEPLKAYYKAHFIQAFTIPSGAMEPTLLVGDDVMVDKSAYRGPAPQRGDIVVFAYPQDARRDFIKRIIGIPGDTVVVRGQQVLVNGEALVEPYVKLDAATPAASAQPGYCGYAYACEPARVPADSYFVMGDNRQNSQDSRYWGFVKREKIKGKAYQIYWSWDGDRHWPRFDRIGRSL